MECVDLDLDVDLDIDIDLDLDLDVDVVVVVASDDGESLQRETHCEISVSIQISHDRNDIHETILGILIFINVNMTLLDSIITQSLQESPDSFRSLSNQKIDP
jgi:hypothetical protein